MQEIHVGQISQYYTLSPDLHVKYLTSCQQIFGSSDNLHVNYLNVLTSCQQIFGSSDNIT